MRRTYRPHLRAPAAGIAVRAIPSSRALVVRVAIVAACAGCGLDEIPRARIAPTAASGTPSAGGTTSGNGTGGAPARGGAGGPSSGAAGVTIDGVFVPRARAVVFLHIGHSNMAGRATGPDELRAHFFTPAARLWSYRDGSFVPAREPTAPDDATGTRAGPGMALLRAAASGAPADVHFISIGHGHSGTYGGNCAGFRRGGLLYDIVMKPARALQGQVTYGAIFTMLGQSEHRTPAAEQAVFATCMQAVAANMREDLGTPELPFMVGDYEAGINRADIGPQSAFAQQLRSQLMRIPGLVTRAALIPTDGLPMEDTHHFDMAGHKQWAERAIEILRARGWASW